MPKQTYSIGYGSNDFFYSEENIDKLLQTIPFNTANLINWSAKYDTKLDVAKLNTKSNKELLFDDSIVSVVKQNSNSFINDYLPGNVAINNNFNAIALGLAAVDGPTLENEVTVDGSLDITSSVSKYNIPLSSIGKTTLKYSTKNNNLNPSMQLNTNVQQQNTVEVESKPNPSGSSGTGGTSTQTTTVSLNTINPRCRFVNNCTENHLHYKTCTTQTYVDKNTGQNYCKCVCQGPQTVDNNPHSHCTSINISTDPNVNAANGLSQDFVNKYNSQSTISNVLKQVKLNLNATLPNTNVSDFNGKLVSNYSNKSQLVDTDANVRNMIYKYYVALADNKKNQELLKSNDTFNNTSYEANKDAVIKYRKQYLELFNITVGILAVSSYIYVLVKK